MDYEITPAQLKQKLESGDPLVLLDVRESTELLAARIDGTLHIPMGEIPMRAQELDPEEHIVVICHHGVRSLNVTNWLRRQGFERVQSMRGGIDRWSREVDPGVPTY